MDESRKPIGYKVVSGTMKGTTGKVIEREQVGHTTTYRVSVSSPDGVTQEATVTKGQIEMMESLRMIEIEYELPAAKGKKK